jgi:hypothetical protein
MTHISLSSDTHARAPQNPIFAEGDEKEERKKRVISHESEIFSVFKIM